MDKHYYHTYYHAERRHWWFRARKEILRSYIARHIHRGAPLRILNVGAATGASSEMLMAFGAVTSVEYDRDCIELVRDRLDFEILPGDIRRLAFPDDHFDLVCAFDVVEHVEDDRRAVAELVRVCRPGGNLLLTVPAFMSLWSEHDVVNHHFRRYERPGLEALLATQPACRPRFVSYFNARLFPLVYLARRLARGRTRPQAGRPLRSDVEKYQSGILTPLLYRVMAGEKRRLLRQRPYARGVSILAHYEKG